MKKRIDEPEVKVIGWAIITHPSGAISSFPNGQYIEESEGSSPVGGISFELDEQVYVQ